MMKSLEPTVMKALKARAKARRPARERPNERSAFELRPLSKGRRRGERKSENEKLVDEHGVERGWRRRRRTWRVLSGFVGEGLGGKRIYRVCPLSTEHLSGGAVLYAPLHRYAKQKGIYQVTILLGNLYQRW